MKQLLPQLVKPRNKRPSSPPPGIAESCPQDPFGCCEGRGCLDPDEGGRSGSTVSTSQTEIWYWRLAQHPLCQCIVMYCLEKVFPAAARKYRNPRMQNVLLVASCVMHLRSRRFDSENMALLHLDSQHSGVDVKCGPDTSAEPFFISV